MPFMVSRTCSSKSTPLNTGATGVRRAWPLEVPPPARIVTATSDATPARRARPYVCPNMACSLRPPKWRRPSSREYAGPGKIPPGRDGSRRRRLRRRGPEHEGVADDRPFAGRAADHPPSAAFDQGNQEATVEETEPAIFLRASVFVRLDGLVKEAGEEQGTLVLDVAPQHREDAPAVGRRLVGDHGEHRDDVEVGADGERRRGGQRRAACVVERVIRVHEVVLEPFVVDAGTQKIDQAAIDVDADVASDRQLRVDDGLAEADAAADVEQACGRVRAES